MGLGTRWCVARCGGRKQDVTVSRDIRLEQVREILHDCQAVIIFADQPATSSTTITFITTTSVSTTTTTTTYYLTYYLLLSTAIRCIITIFNALLYLELYVSWLDTVLRIVAFAVVAIVRWCGCTSHRPTGFVYVMCLSCFDCLVWRVQDAPFILESSRTSHPA